MIRTIPYDPHSAMVIFRQLDPFDLIEAQLTRGAHADHLTLFAEWHAMQGNCLLSLVVTTGEAQGAVPFALLALGHTGQAGVAQAALLARDHQRFARPLARVALTIAREMPALVKDAGIHRIEARAWWGHPNAARFLRASGFRAECTMPGFGATGRVMFQQFAFVSPSLQEQE